MTKSETMSMSETTTVEDVARRVNALSKPRVIVGISGFGGAGKSTLADALKPLVEPAEVVRVDDFLTGRAEERSTNWSCVDRDRLRAQALEPFTSGLPARYQVYDWQADAPAQWIDIGDVNRLIVEGIGLFHPDLIPLLDVMVWADCPAEVALERARHRDRLQGQDDHNDEMWLTVWAPNDADFFETFKPRDAAHFVIATSGS